MTTESEGAETSAGHVPVYLRATIAGLGPALIQISPLTPEQEVEAANSRFAAREEPPPASDLASCASAEVEITPEMREAGLEVLRDQCYGEWPEFSEDVARAVFAAMFRLCAPRTIAPGASSISR